MVDEADLLMLANADVEELNDCVLVSPSTLKLQPGALCNIANVPSSLGKSV